MSRILVGLIGLMLFKIQTIRAQFAPHLGVLGHIAISVDSPSFIGWATGCEVNRGWQQMDDTSYGKVNQGEPIDALGPADGLQVISLGDGGTATLTFIEPIQNLPGYDFAVFENGFMDFFLELAFVEVSSDGENFVRFPASSLTPFLEQIGPFDYLEPIQLNNLAGKYPRLYGTPFDLEELKDSANLNVNTITHVRIVDVVGSIIPEFATYDQEGRIVNDPWPTPFPSSGFDLDAVGVLSGLQLNTNTTQNQSFSVYPNPFQDQIFVQSELQTVEYLISDLSGRVIKQGFVESNQGISTDELVAGIYLIELRFNNQTTTLKCSKI
jgi:hypothetical protein